MRFGEACPLWAGDGLVGAKTQFAWGTGPAGDGVASTEEYSGLAAAGLTTMPWVPGIPTASWQAFSDGKSSPDARTVIGPVLYVQPVAHGVGDWLQESPHG